jgi:hypothetical protein
LTACPIIPATTLNSTLESHIPAHRRDLLPHNYAAVARGIQEASRVLGAELV